MEVSGITPFTGCQMIDNEDPYDECVMYEDVYDVNGLYKIPTLSNKRTLENNRGEESNKFQSDVQLGKESLFDKIKHIVKGKNNESMK